MLLNKTAALPKSFITFILLLFSVEYKSHRCSMIELNISKLTTMPMQIINASHS